jgi:hypothetical protein
MQLSASENAQANPLYPAALQKRITALLAALALSEAHATALQFDDGSGVLYCQQIADFRDLARSTQSWLEADLGQSAQPPKRHDLQFQEILAETNHRLANIPDPLVPEHLSDGAIQIQLAELTQFLVEPNRLALRAWEDKSTTLFTAQAKLYSGGGINITTQPVFQKSSDKPVADQRKTASPSGGPNEHEKCELIHTLWEIGRTARDYDLSTAQSFSKVARHTLEHAEGANRLLLEQVCYCFDRLYSGRFEVILNRLDHHFDLAAAQITQPYRQNNDPAILIYSKPPDPLPADAKLNRRDRDALDFCARWKMEMTNWRQLDEPWNQVPDRILKLIASQAALWAQHYATPETAALRANPFNGLRPRNSLQFLTAAKTNPVITFPRPATQAPERTDSPRPMALRAAAGF